MRIRACSVRFALAAALALAAPAQGQMNFDLVLYDRIEADLRLSTLSGWGLLVNTGSVPITSSQWRAALLFGRSSGLQPELALEAAECTRWVIYPGEAVGNRDPLLLAHLRPGERLGPVACEVLYGTSGGAASTATQTLEYAVQIAAPAPRLVRAQTTFIYGSGAVYQPLTARRFVSEPALAHVGSFGAGCDLGGNTLDLVAWSPGDAASRVARGSTLPIPGNAAFGVELRGRFDLALANRPCFLWLHGRPSYIELLDCSLWLGAEPLHVAVGVFTAPYGYVEPVRFRLPIPSVGGLEGSTAWLQAIVPAASAANGVFAASQALFATVGSAVD